MAGADPVRSTAAPGRLTRPVSRTPGTTWTRRAGPGRCALASATLRRLTGYRVGGCPITVRPCKRGCADLLMTRSYYDMLSMGYGVSFWPHISGEGLWVNSCGCATDCSCEALCSIKLPAPVGRVDAVKIDGAVLDHRRRTGSTATNWSGSATTARSPPART